MRKTVLIFAMALFFGNAFNGSSFASINNQDLMTAQSEVYQEITERKFTLIKLDDLPKAVKDAAEKEAENVTLQNAERKVLPNGEKVYRVTMEVEGKGQVTKKFYANGRKHDG